MYPNRLVRTLLLATAVTFFAKVGAEEAVPHRAESGSAQASEASPAEQTPSPTERMNRRFPQKVRVGDLIDLPLLDFDDRTLGHVEQVARTETGKVVLVMTLSSSWFGKGGRTVGIPIETVAILARHINILDIPRDEVLALPAWESDAGVAISPEETIRIAISRR